MTNSPTYETKRPRFVRLNDLYLGSTLVLLVMLRFQCATLMYLIDGYDIFRFLIMSLFTKAMVSMTLCVNICTRSALDMPIY